MLERPSWRVCAFDERFSAVQTPMAGLTLLLIVAWSADRLSAQSVTIRAGADTLHVRAPGFGVIKGATLGRLKNGRTVRFELELAVLPQPGGPAATQIRQGFVLSYDLWEERFAVTKTGPSPRSISHLRADDADAWCLEQLAVPLSALGRLGRDAPFWIRLEFRIQDDDPSRADENGGYTLRGLIERLSRRRADDDLRDWLEAGPFRLGK